MWRQDLLNAFCNVLFPNGIAETFFQEPPYEAVAIFFRSGTSPFCGQAAVWGAPRRLRRLLLRLFARGSSVGGSEGFTEGVSKRKRSHHCTVVRSSRLVSAATRRYANASLNSGLAITEAGRRGGLLRRETWRARMANSRSPTRPGTDAV